MTTALRNVNGSASSRNCRRAAFAVASRKYMGYLDARGRWFESSRPDHFHIFRQFPTRLKMGGVGAVTGARRGRRIIQVLQTARIPITSRLLEICAFMPPSLRTERTTHFRDIARLAQVRAGPPTIV